MFNPARPYFYLLAYIAIVYLRPQEYVPALLESPLVPVSLLIAAVFWLFAQPRNFEAPQHALLVGLLFAIFLSVLMTGWLTGAANAFMDFLPTMLLFYMVATSVDSLKRFREMAIVLTILSGALRSWMMTRGEAVTTSSSVRAMVPVSIRTSQDSTGNQIAAFLCDLPIGEPDPVIRLERIRFELDMLKETGQMLP